jgi:ABC-type transporter Mla subunit MlaD
VRTPAAIAAFALAVGVALAGCGGSTSPQEKWASSVCTSISTWQQKVNKVTSDAADALAQPGATRADVDDAVNAGIDSTQTLIDDLKQLGPPDTANGAQAQQQVDAFLAQAKEALAGVKRALTTIPPNAKLTTIVTQLSGQAASLQQTIARGTNLVASLVAMGGDLKDGFESADSCKNLR